jgi:penicillin-binding protein 2
MRGLFAAAIVAGLVVGGAVAGVRAFAGDEGSAPGAPDGKPAVAGSPKVTAQAFATAWTSGALANLYPLLDVESQRRYPLAGFLETYNAFHRELTVTRAVVAVAAADDASASLSVRLTTAYFGEIEYTITLAFTRAGGSYFVHWDPSAVHPEMTAGSVFKSTIERPARGAILDRNGAPLAITRDVRMLGLNRATVADRAALTAALVDRIGFTREQVDQAFASKAGATQRIAVGHVPDDRAEAAAGLLRSVPGVLLYFESQRVHPLGPAAAHVVGYTRELTADELDARPGQGFKVGDRVGATGLEASMEGTLAGKIGAELRIVDPGAATVRIVSSREFVAGQDVKTTLDAAVLAKAQERLGARAGAVVVIDPRTNAVLALNSSPSFDPDAFERNDAAALAAISAAPNGPQANRATTGLYSAGSTFKLITGTAGLLHGGYNPRDQLLCSAVWSGIDPPRKNWEGGQGALTIAEALMRSCNTVFYEIGLTLYNATDGALSNTARAFGFGAATGVVGLSEEDGLVPDAAWKRKNRNEPWYPGDEVNLAIGQGDLLITPLQLANAYSAFLNNELRVPVIVAGQPATSRGKLGLTPAQHAHLRLGLELVTSAAGTASAAFANAGYTNFGGKSGTAEDAGAQQHVLFVAYAPKSAPQAVAAVFLDEGKSGSIEAGPIARDVVLAALR